MYLTPGKCYPSDMSLFCNSIDIFSNKFYITFYHTSIVKIITTYELIFETTVTQPVKRKMFALCSLGTLWPLLLKPKKCYEIFGYVCFIVSQYSNNEVIN